MVKASCRYFVVTFAVRAAKSVAEQHCDAGHGSAKPGSDSGFGARQHD